MRRVCQKMHMGNCIKSLTVRRVDYVAEWNSFSWEKSHFCFTQLAEAKCGRQTLFYHRRNGEYPSVGRRRKHIWQLATTSFRHSRTNGKFRPYMQHKPQKAARAELNRYAEHFWPFGFVGAESLLNGRCSYFKGNYLLIMQQKIILKHLSGI